MREVTIELPGVGRLIAREPMIAAWQRVAARAQDLGLLPTAMAVIGLGLIRDPEIAAAHKAAKGDLQAFADAVQEWLHDRGLPLTSEALGACVEAQVKIQEGTVARIHALIAADDLAGNSTAPAGPGTSP